LEKFSVPICQIRIYYWPVSSDLPYTIPKDMSLRSQQFIQQRVTAVLRSIPKQTFADSFQKLYERCQQCVVKDGDYFEGQ
jgi:hypothetical protein